MNDGVSWKVSTPNVCSTTLPTSDDRLPVIACVARVVMMSVCVWFGFCSARSSGATSCVPVRAHVAEQQRQDVGGRQRRIRVERRPQLLAGAGERDGDAIGLPRHAHVGLRLDVEERLDPRRVGEIHRAARDPVAPALERHLAALDVGVADDHRPIVGAAQRQVGAGDHAAPGCSRPAASTAPAAGCRTSAAPSAPARPAPAAAAGAGSPRRRDRRCCPACRSRRFQSALFTVTVPPSVGALKLPRSDRSASTTERTPSGTRRCMSSPRAVTSSSAGHVAVEPDAAAELHPPAAHRRRHVVEADAAGVEADRAVDRVERVRASRSGGCGRR